MRRVCGLPSLQLTVVDDVQEVVEQSASAIVAVGESEAARKFSPEIVTTQPNVAARFFCTPTLRVGESRVKLARLVPTTAPTVTGAYADSSRVGFVTEQRTQLIDVHAVVVHTVLDIAAVGVNAAKPKLRPLIVRVEPPDEGMLAFAWLETGASKLKDDEDVYPTVDHTLSQSSTWNPLFWPALRLLAPNAHLIVVTLVHDVLAHAAPEL